MKIICIGKNYRETIEIFDKTTVQPIVVFMKPDTAIHNLEIPYYIPDFTKDLHYEIELVLKINQNGKCISEKFAHKYYDEIAVGIDFTACDLQAELSQKGLPWELAKAFDGSAIVGKFVSKETIESSSSIQFHLDKNGSTVQEGNTTQMLRSFDVIISEVSQFFTLRKGDLIFTGTPKGAGRVATGNVLEGFLMGEKGFSLKIR
ncbi:fumarylacetoacetate (FAA) hydrolase [Capnocytophaga ochracea DSM 7271]|uniref:Fumarylacetoacetate (FAA) hydrolase n=1 Tax=Capnocytophaga ochracea (strain ATCC 27872 / DSM 7271 / CCUG 9716 / JCM 12966 / NCTC 12371 / SS31 / VPI 2845) TaxID=521097 RepID=C7M3M4_CAPOD|nr:fumarylacetoacetate hydrolase family protein [Capnocytophaga ochracea]ACU93650.1 fumarylacetoacetate (FAA) hydrolase [Capnocytophaga ochracea DSM 7271]UAK50263.1 fumarylacetoacetate hydrolase family protein [Capnocytophaga ochracea]